jgi:hypothetical protein
MKVHGTKKQVARDIWARLQKGPELRVSPRVAEELGLSLAYARKIETDMINQCRTWLNSWITPDVKKLVPKEFWPLARLGSVCEKTLQPCRLSRLPNDGRPLPIGRPGVNWKCEDCQRITTEGPDVTTIAR